MGVFRMGSIKKFSKKIVGHSSTMMPPNESTPTWILKHWRRQSTRSMGKKETPCNTKSRRCVPCGMISCFIRLLFSPAILFTISRLSYRFHFSSAARAKLRKIFRGVSLFIVISERLPLTTGAVMKACVFSIIFQPFRQFFLHAIILLYADCI